MAIKDMYLTIAGAAKELGVSRQTIYRWLEGKRFPSEKIGGVILIDKKSILEFKAKQIDESFLQIVLSSVDEYIRREYKYTKDDKIEGVASEDKCITFVVKKKDGKSEKIKIGGLDIVFSIGRKERNVGIRSIKFKDTTITEYEQSQDKEEGGKKTK